MFNWLVTPKKEDEYQIPTPPKPNMEVALNVRRNKYIPVNLPDEMGDEIADAFAERRCRQMDRQNYMDQLKDEIYFVYKQRKDRSSMLNYFFHNLSPEIYDEYKRRLIFRIDQCAHRIRMAGVCQQIVSRHAFFYGDVLEGQETEEETSKDSEDEQESSREESSREESSEEFYFPSNKRRRSGSLPIMNWEQKMTEWGYDKNSIDDKCFSISLDNGHSANVTYEDMQRISKEIEEDYVNMEMEEEKPKRYTEGYLEVVMGPMFSGKSSKILFKLSSMADQRFKCLYVNSIKDVRNTEAQDENVTTHNSTYSRLSNKIDKMKVSSLKEINVSKYDYIAIDELQFFNDDDTVQCIRDWIDLYGKHVLVASLDGDCYRRKFGCVLDLVPHADEIIKLTAYCDLCRDNYGIVKKAPFTARMTSETTAELVGGVDMYKAMCRSCHDFHLDITSSYN